MEEGYGIPGPEAYMLLGQIAEARCTQMVNPKYTYVCKVDKSLLDRITAEQVSTQSPSWR